MNPLCGEKRWYWAQSKRSPRPMETCYNLEEEGESVVVRFDISHLQAHCRTK